MIDEVRKDLTSMEDQWGVKIHEIGFSTFSPSPETLEVTQLVRLAEEKHALFIRFREAGLSEQAAVSLISGAVVAVPASADKEPDVVDDQVPPHEPPHDSLPSTETEVE